MTIRSSCLPPPCASLLSWTVSFLLLLAVIGFGSRPAAQVPPGDPQRQRKPEKPYALIYGTVYDAGGRSVYGVRVKIRRSSDKKTRWELYSDHSGEFAQRVPTGPDSYVIWADLRDYKALNGRKLGAGPEVTVHIENDERTDVSLHLK